MEHQGNVAIVTGGASGIGRATVLALAREGAAVAIADINAEAAARVQAEVEAAGGRALAIPTDVSSAAAVDRLFDRVAATFGRLDILVCDAAVYLAKFIADTTEDEFDRLVAVNLKGVFLCCRAAVPHLIAAGGGRIVNVSSGAAIRGYPFTPAYSASKAGILGLSKALALELAPRNILVNVVVPGMTDTPMARAGVTPEQWDASSRAANPLGRAGQPEDVADVIVMLTRAATRHMTGQTVMANGGAIMP
jgi:NAD(P)-dependent dehydrogenase (short-subunit alcohol dehydrogenase family)